MAYKRTSKLNATKHIPLEEKVIYYRYEIKGLGFCWLIAELDKKENLAFGCANLNNDDFAEWGYISVDELLDNGAELDRDWKPCTSNDAIKRIGEERIKGKEVRRIVEKEKYGEKEESAFPS